MQKELALQQYIWANRTRWKDLLLPLELDECDDELAYDFEGATFEMDGELVTMEPETFYSEPNPGSIFSSLISRRIRDFYEHVEDLLFLGKEIGFAKATDSTIRIDFLAYSSGRTGFTIIELKANPKQAREAFTEMLAYGNHLQTLFPGMSIDDLFFLVIAPMDVRIVRESVVNMLLFQQRAIMALEPIPQEDGNWRFKPWMPTQNDLILYSNDLFAENNFDVVKILWEDIPGFWNPESPEESNADYIDVMNRVSSYCAQLMEARQINGFVYTSQAPSAWKKAGFDLLNDLVIVGINPFKNKLSTGEKLTDLIPDLVKYIDQPESELSFLEITWSNNLMSIGREIVQFMTTNLSNKKYHLEMTTLDWKQHFHDLMEYGVNANFRIFSTGFFRQLYFEYLRLDYKFMQQYGHEKHDYWNHGDVPEFIVDNFYYHEFFLDFVSRLHDPYREYRDFDNDSDDDVLP